ncbi:ImmA/IrrE family metallo-endopeptidase [Enterococcus sp. BWM-S5]|uniref:ImmA/IrrE family metallo-endopeptidase n=1 Tax=Enterococcus larvae TaxID=2794352 RepID=A0ABS4CF93_9ENTE|nr:ImmA/IrrE family metallo-endopeptidase [Enterococcus larvae]MBP1044888.1 ImmA/IrrE family metallo-endopeptidase [Enterococcus larvae]
MTTKLPSKARYSRSTSRALLFLTKEEIQDFPVDMVKVCKKFGIKLKKYSTLAKKNNVSVEVIGMAFKSQLGYIYLSPEDKYIISYNDTLPKGLVRFTLAHEFGHFFLSHLEDFEETELRYNSLVPYSKEHESLEREANCFARNILSPTPVATLFHSNSTLSLQYFFGLTYTAAQVRMSSLEMDKKNLESILYRLGSKSNQPVRYLSDIQLRYKTLCHCDTCNGEFHTELGHYCPYCGESSIFNIDLNSYSVFREFGGDKVEYTRIETNENRTPLKCPRCEYESLEDKFNYCPMCSIRIHNECLGSEKDKFEEDHHGNWTERPIHERIQYGCGGYLDGGFRYCPHCGSETSYSKQKLLADWKEEKNALDIFE